MAGEWGLLIGHAMRISRERAYRREQESLAADARYLMQVDAAFAQECIARGLQPVPTPAEFRDLQARHSDFRATRNDGQRFEVAKENAYFVAYDAAITAVARAQRAERIRNGSDMRAARNRMAAWYGSAGTLVYASGMVYFVAEEPQATRTGAVVVYGAGAAATVWRGRRAQTKWEAERVLHRDSIPPPPPPPRDWNPMGR